MKQKILDTQKNPSLEHQDIPMNLKTTYLTVFYIKKQKMNIGKFISKNKVIFASNKVFCYMASFFKKAGQITSR